MSVTVGFLALLEAKPDKADELAAFLERRSSRSRARRPSTAMRNIGPLYPRRSRVLARITGR